MGSFTKSGRSTVSDFNQTFNVSSSISSKEVGLLGSGFGFSFSDAWGLNTRGSPPESTIKIKNRAPTTTQDQLDDPVRPGHSGCFLNYIANDVL
jgi:hypothetical protein